MGNFINKLDNYQIIPRELIFDKSMTDRARFVYCYMSAKPNDWNFYLETMSKEIGYHVETLRKYINELIKAGWLTKGEQINNGRYGAVQYTLNSSKQRTGNTVTEKYRDGEKHSHTEIDNKHITDNIKEKKEEDNISNSKFNFKKSLINIGVSDDIANDWMIVRKNKKSSNTKVAFNAIEKEIIKADISPNDCIRIAVERSWCGFNASWLANIDTSDCLKKNDATEQPSKYNWQ